MGPSAADVVCAGRTRHHPRRTALCVHGPVAAPAASFATIARYVVASLGSDLVVLVNVSTSSTSSTSAKAVIEAARVHFDTALVSVERRADAMAPHCSSRGALSLSTADEVLLDSRRRCFADVARLESTTQTVFDEVLYVPADHLWTRPLWPLCMHSEATSLRGVRVQGLVWWTGRAHAEIALARPADDYWRQPELRACAPGEDSSTGRVHLSHWLRTHAQSHRLTLQPDASLAGCAMTRDVLGSGHESDAAISEPAREHRQPEQLHWLGPPSFNCSASPTAAFAADASAFAAYSWQLDGPRSSSSGPSTSRLQLRPPCCDACACARREFAELGPAAFDAYATYGAHATQQTDGNPDNARKGGGSGRRRGRYGPRSEPRLATGVTPAVASRAVCGVHVAPPRLALVIAGLARTFASPLTHQTIRGNIVDALGAQTTVFAFLRLEDARGITRFGARSARTKLTRTLR